MSIDAEGVDVAAPEKNAMGNMTGSDALEMLMKSRSSKGLEEEQVPDTEDNVEVEEEDDDTEVEDSTEVESTETDTDDFDDVLSQLDLENLSEDQLSKLKETIKSKAVGRFGELTRKRKEAEEEAQLLRRKLEQMNASAEDQLKSNKVENNPYSNIGEVEKLKEIYENNESLIEWAEDILDENSDASSDEVIATIGDKEYTKSEVKRNLKEARKANKKYLPNQLQEINKREAYKAQSKHYENLEEQEIKWNNDEDSQEYKAYKEVSKSPLIEEINEAFPQYSHLMNYLLKHAINSKLGRNPVKEKVEPAKAKKPRPPSNIGSNNLAPASNPSTDKSNRVKKLKDRLGDTNSAQDFIAIRTAQLSR